MENKLVVLEYFKIFLSPAPITAVVVLISFCCFGEEFKALIKRIAKIKLPGGGELSTSQIEKSAEVPAGNPEPPRPVDDPNVPQLAQKTQDLESLRQMFNAERARAYLWEYRYLNYFLARHTQLFLDWLASLANPITVALADTFWLPTVQNPDERRAVLDALRMHYLVQVNNDIIEITPKGREYIQWRGPLPQSPS